MSDLYFIDKCRIRFEPFLQKFLIGTTEDFRPNVLGNSSVAILQLIHKGYTLDSIVEIFKEKYGETCINDVVNYFNKLVQKGHLTKEKPLKQYIDFTRTNALSDNYYFYAPDRVQLEITRSCNMKCDHCYHPGTDSQQEMMDLEMIKKMIDEFSEQGVFVIQLSGGEPFLHPDIGKIVDYIYDKHMAVQIFTNANFLDNYLTHDFVGKVMEFIISLDGDEEFHDKFRSLKGAYAKTLENTKQVLKLGAKVKISYSLVEDNMKYVQEAHDLLVSLGVDSFVCGVPVPIGNAKDIDYTVEKYRKLQIFVSEFYEKNNVETTNRKEGYQFYEKLPLEFSCSAGKAFLYISTDYDVFPCPFFAQHNFKLYNMFDGEDHVAIWHDSPLLKEFRDVRISSTKGCTDCDTCKYWCRACVYNLTGKINGAPTFCYLSKGDINES